VLAGTSILVTNASLNFLRKGRGVSRHRLSDVSGPATPSPNQLSYGMAVRLSINFPAL
jgi:hypothetical protein